MADNQQQIDHYDFINAPQFVDFNDLAAQDDPDADKFFETHREEDDFMIPLDINVSPTAQLLSDGNDDDADENEHYSNAANKAAVAAGLEDVKIEYYASPTTTVILSQPNSGSNKKSLNSMYGTPLGGSSGLSSNASFYTPTAGSGSEDKENRTPTPVSLSSTKTKLGPSIKMGNSGLINSNSQEKCKRSALIDQKFDGGSNSASPAYSSSESTKKPNDVSEAAQSLISCFDQLSIVSSDEEEINNGDQHYAPVEQLSTHASDDLRKLLDEFAPSNNSESSDEEGANGCGMKPHSPADKMLEAQLSLVENRNENDDDLRCSIVVAPKVGEQVHWNSNDEAGASKISNNHFQNWNISLQQQQSVFAAEAYGHSNGSVHGKVGQANGYFHEESGESTLDCFGSDISSSGTGDAGEGTMYKNRRASSVGDLVRAIEVEPKARQFETYGYIPRMGITIPKTPDVNTTGGNSIQQHQRSEAVPECSSQNKNSCYFEIEAPIPVKKSVRRVSSCSDLVSLQQKAKQSARAGVSRASRVPQKKALTIPKTPEALKRTQKSHAAKKDADTASSAGSTTSKIGIPSMRDRGGGSKMAGPSVADRLAAAKSRQPIKANHYVSMAEAMINYQKNTPDRFRSLPRGRVPEKRATSCDSRKRGAPSPARSPEHRAAATTSSRSRADSFSERKESNFTRNACPVLQKKADLKPTIPRPFNLSCGQRARPVPNDEDVVDFKFKARPAPSKVHEGAPLLKSRSKVKVTMPMSPHFASDDRLKERHQKRAQTKSPEPKQVKSAVPLHHSKPSRLPTATPSSSGRAPTTHHHTAEEHLKTTVSQPFSSSFDARQKEILRRKEEKVKQELLEETKKSHREFHANPVPKFSSAKLPKKKPVEATHVEPFRLKSDERGAHYQVVLKRKLEEEEHRLKQLAQFHAQPADVVHKPPFEPERPTRVIEGPLGFHLATQQRAQEREQFDEQLREKEREEEERRRKEQEMLEELQKQEDLEKRRQLVHKAQPFKAPKPFQLKSSGKPLTVPQSPAFSAMPSERRINKPYSPNTSDSSNH